MRLTIPQPQLLKTLQMVERAVNDLGMVAPGKSADFVVLDANPLDDITNTRRIARVFLRGHEVDRARLRAAWTSGSSTN